MYFKYTYQSDYLMARYYVHINLFLSNNSQACDRKSIKKFQWEIMAKPEELGVLKSDDAFSWVALSLSSDKKFGDELTFPCTNAPGAKEVKTFSIH